MRDNPENNSSSKAGRISTLPFYIMGFSGLGVILPFLPLILADHGLSDSQVSWAMSFSGIAAAFGPPFFAMLSDSRVSFSRLLPILLLSSSIFTFSLIIANSFFLASLVVFLQVCFHLSATSLGDQYLLSMEESHGIKFHTFRAFGSLGFIAPSLFLLALSLLFPPDTIFITCLGGCILLLATIFSLRVPHAPKPIKSKGLPTFEALKFAWSRPTRDIIIASFLCGIGISIFYIVFPRYLQELGVKKEWIGMIINLGVLSEVILIPYARKLLKVFSARTLIFAAIIATAIRFISLATLPYMPVICIVQVFHSLLVVGFFVAVPIYFKETAARAYQYSIQSLYIALVIGIARFLGPALNALWLNSSELEGLLALRSSLLLAGVFCVVAGFWAYFELIKQREPQ